MRIHALGLIALLTVPSIVAAQGVRRPGTVRRPTPGAQPLPPEAPAVARALALQRSRWSAEGYGFVDAIELPAVAGGGMARFTTGGAGSHADYRYADHYSATVDLAASLFGGPATTLSAEVGERWAPFSWDHQVRPFVDVRAAYMRVNDTFDAPFGVPGIDGSSGDAIIAGSRYSHGFGGVAGTGFEYSITNSFAVTTEITALRGRMTTYRLNAQNGDIPSGSSYWMNSFRYTIGLKFNPMRKQNMVQKPR